MTTCVQRLSLEARVALVDLWERYGFPGHDFYRQEWEFGISTIAVAFSVERDDAREYLKRISMLWSSYNQRYNIYLFLEQDGWEERQPCIGLRSGRMYVPRRCSVIGLLAHGKALLTVPPLDTQEQRDQLRQKVVEALLLAGDMHAEEKAVTLISTGYVDIKHYWGLPKFHRAAA